MHKISNLHNWVSELPEAIAADVREQFVLRSLADGEHLYHQGDDPVACYQVVQGRLKICNYNYAGQELVHAHLMPDDCVGDWGLLIDEPRMNNAIACGATEVNVLRRADFNAAYDQHPEIARALNRVMARRLRLAFMLSEDASLLPLRQRLARVVIRMGHSQGLKGPDGRITIEGISHEELAKMVGVARQSVGKELKKLEQEGSIAIQYGKLIINDIAAFGDQYDRLVSVEPVVADYD